MANKMRSNLPDTDLVKARLEIVNARRDFEAEMERLWAERSAAVRTRLDHLVWQMRYEQGKSVTYICEQYGTKDRNTIYAILERAELVWGVPAKTRTCTPAVTTEPDNTERYTLTDLDERLWLVTDSTGGRTVEVNKVTRKTGVNTGEPALGPEMRRDPGHEAWAVVPTTTNGDQP